MKVLLVDDSDDDRLLFRAAFNQSGLRGEIVEKEDGDEAIAFLGQIAKQDCDQWPDAIFLDLKMPQRNGFEVLEWIRSKKTLRLLKIFVLSGSNEAADVQRAAQFSIADYLVKPISSDKIRTLLLPGKVTTRL